MDFLLPKSRFERFIDAYLKRHQRISELFEKSPLVKIGLPYDGESFDYATPGECADKLEELRELGYNVPQYAIDALREEQAELEGQDCE